jgi:RNA polymerase sigma-70 factor (ECF subfamily)
MRGAGWCVRDSRGDVAEAMQAHLNSAWSLALWLVRDRTLAEEVVQDAAERALRYAASFRGGADELRPWLLQIVRTTALDALSRRRRGAEEPLPEADDAAPLIERAPNPEEAFALSQSVRALDQAVAALPAEWRECLILRELEGLSYREIAQVVGVPMGTVMSRLWRARQALLAWRAARAAAAAAS